MKGGGKGRDPFRLGSESSSGALPPPGTWYRNCEASRAREERGRERERALSLSCTARLLSRPVKDRGYVTTSVFEIASS